MEETVTIAAPGNDGASPKRLRSLDFGNAGMLILGH